MKRIAIQIRNGLLRDGVLSRLRSSPGFEAADLGWQTDAGAACKRLLPDVLLMEASELAPDCALAARLDTAKTVRAALPGCKIALLVDENAERELAEDVKRARVDGTIDLFIYASTSGSFMAAQLETL